MARKAGRKPPRFTSKAISEFLDAIDDSSIHLVGWTLVPVNMMNTSGEAGKGRKAFLPVDALDCAGFKCRGQGHFFLARMFCVSCTLLVTHVYICLTNFVTHHLPTCTYPTYLTHKPTHPLTHHQASTYLFRPLPTSTRSPAHPLTRSSSHPLTPPTTTCLSLHPNTRTLAWTH